jgi:predicted RNA-binding protein YlqC (UPF0109 family)
MKKDETIERVRVMLEELTTMLVDGDVTVRVETSEDGCTFHLVVEREDIGKLVGKQGRTARALRTILSRISMKERMRMSLNVPVEDGSAHA